MKPQDTLLLTRREVAALLNIEECIKAVENAFKLYGEGKTAPPGILGIHAHDGGFHIKAGLLEVGRHYFVPRPMPIFRKICNVTVCPRFKASSSSATLRTVIRWQ